MVKQIILAHLSHCDAVDQPSIAEIAKSINRPVWQVRSEVNALLASGDLCRTRLGYRLAD